MAIAEEVAWTARELGLHRPVLVVHSMGAIGLELVRQQPDLASALLVAALLETPQPVLVATWEQFLAYDPAPAAAACKVPLLYVNSVMPHDEARMRQVCLHVVIGRTVGAGHFHQLEVPGQINAMIDRFLATRGVGDSW